MPSSRWFRPLCPALLLSALFGAGVARAEIQPSSEVLVPYFEVSLGESQTPDITTLFAVSNWASVPVEVKIQVHTNWGIPVLTLTRVIDPDAVFTANLRDWVCYGRLPDRTLKPAELAHLQAALSGQPSPRDQMFYSKEVTPHLATGYVTIETTGLDHHDALWGDYFIVNSSDKDAEGETLVNIDKPAECMPSCERHGVRYMAAGTTTKLGPHSEVMIWTPINGHPSPTTELTDTDRVDVRVLVYGEDGKLVDQRNLRILPLEWIDVATLGLDRPFGWFEIETSTESFITAHFIAAEQFHAGLHSYCLPLAASLFTSQPSIDLEKFVNGSDADSPTGPEVPVGGALRWELLVRNTGSVPLSEVTITEEGNLQVFCPGTELAPGESMTCTATGTAVACQHYNLATVTGKGPEGTVSDEDGAYYMGVEDAAIDIEKMVQGQDADTPGEAPGIPYGDPVTWTYHVTNTGKVRLSGVTVFDDAGLLVTCPKTALEASESMTCTAGGTAEAGLHSNIGRVTGSPSCGPPVTDQDPAYYYGQVDAGIAIVKSANGEDANMPPGPIVLVGSTVHWTYLVTNVGKVRLTNVMVSDDRGLDVTCPKTMLEAGEAMTCTASGIALSGQYANVGTATGTPPVGSPVTASDPSHYFGQRPAIGIAKLTNGQDGPTLRAGDPVVWTYVVTNTGDIRLTQVGVTDDRGVAVTCPKTVLEPGEVMTCTAHGTVVAGPYTNIGTATGTPPAGPAVTATDPSNYLGVAPNISIEKMTNGQDANTETGPVVAVGSVVQWAYVVANTGDVPLTQVMVTDDRGVAVSCPKSTLQPGESMTCTAQGTATAGQYQNLGTATGLPPVGAAVTATDPSHYFGQNASIDLQKLVNGQDADTAPGPTISVGETVLWTYVVTNTGNVRLTGIVVSDDQEVTVTCPKTALDPAESMTCTSSAKAVAGHYVNVGTVRGTPPTGPDVMASDPAHYTGCQHGTQGCTPGYWKNHTSSWPPTGYSTSQHVHSVFTTVTTYYPTLGNASLLNALYFGGGSGNQGAAEILLRAAVAAVLNAAHPDVAYPRGEAAVIADVNSALLQSRDAMLALAAELDADNNRGCPLH